MIRLNRDKHLLKFDAIPFILLFSFLFLLPCRSIATPFSTTNASVSFNKIVVTLQDAQTNEPIIGATINTEDFSFTTITDFDGKAVLEGLTYRGRIRWRRSSWSKR